MLEKCQTCRRYICEHTRAEDVERELAAKWEPPSQMFRAIRLFGLKPSCEREAS
jgi:hypothetical protein